MIYMNKNDNITELLNKLVAIGYIKRSNYNHLTYSYNYKFRSDIFKRVVGHNTDYFTYGNTILLPFDSTYKKWVWTQISSNIKYFKNRLKNLELYIDSLVSDLDIDIETIII